MVKAKAKSKKAAEPPHPLICPFSGKPMKIIRTSDGLGYIVRSPHGFSSRILFSEEKAREWAGTRNGKTTYEAPKIEVRDREPPVRDAEEGLEEIAPNPDSVSDDDLPDSLK